MLRNCRKPHVEDGAVHAVLGARDMVPHIHTPLVLDVARDTNHALVGSAAIVVEGVVEGGPNVRKECECDHPCATQAP